MRESRNLAVFGLLEVQSSVDIVEDERRSNVRFSQWDEVRSKGVLLLSESVIDVLTLSVESVKGGKCASERKVPRGEVVVKNCEAGDFARRTSGGGQRPQSYDLDSQDKCLCHLSSFSSVCTGMRSSSIIVNGKSDRCARRCVQSQQ